MIKKLQIDNKTGEYILIGDDDEPIIWKTMSTSFVGKEKQIVNVVVDGKKYDNIPYETLGVAKFNMTDMEMELEREENAKMIVPKDSDIKVSKLETKTYRD